MTRPREAPTFFVDHCLGTAVVAERLRAAGAVVRTLTEAGFAQDCEDAVWLPQVAAKGWAILTKDKRIQRRQLERAALLNSQAGAFVLTGGEMRGAEIAEAFAIALPKMTKLFQTRERPFIATVSAAGGVTIAAGGARAGGVRR